MVLPQAISDFLGLMDFMWVISNFCSIWKSNLVFCVWDLSYRAVQTLSLSTDSDFKCKLTFAHEHTSHFQPWDPLLIPPGDPTLGSCPLKRNLEVWERFWTFNQRKEEDSGYIFPLFSLLWDTVAMTCWGHSPVDAAIKSSQGGQFHNAALFSLLRCSPPRPSHSCSMGLCFLIK